MKKIRLKKSAKKVIKKVIFTACCLVLAWQFASSIKHDFIGNPVVADSNYVYYGSEDFNIADNGSENVKSDLESDNKRASEIYENNKDILQLVNKENRAGEEPPELVSICKGRLKISAEAYDSLKQMLKAAADDGYSYWLASGYRDWKKQQQLVNEDVRKNIKSGMSEGDALAETLKQTAPAGFSEHQTGLALDILCSDNTKMDITQEKCEGNKWLVQHCSEFGFILRYPKGKEDITGYSYEPWHFRYVGKEAAKYIYEKNITLEEFYAIIK